MSLIKSQQYLKLPSREKTVYIAVIFAAVLFVNICGCQSYGYQGIMPNQPARHYTGRTEYGNPSFVFDAPQIRGSGSNISSEQFLRRPWPVSPEAYHPVSTYDISSYEEDFYSYQYISSSGSPYQYFHRRPYGNRVRTSYL